MGSKSPSNPELLKAYWNSPYSFNVYSEKIATFKFSYILNNINSYNNFLNELDIIKKKKI